MTYGPTDLATRDAERQQQSLQRKKAAEEFAIDLRWMMGNARGRRLMWQWLGFCGIYRSPYTADINRTNFNLGAHNVGLMLQAELAKHCPELALKMTNEASKAGGTHRPDDGSQNPAA